MKNIYQFLLFGIAILLVSSCTMEKRVYMSGYNIEWNAGSHKKSKNVALNTVTKSQIKREFVAEINKSVALETKHEEITPVNNELTDYSASTENVIAVPAKSRQAVNKTIYTSAAGKNELHSYTKKAVKETSNYVRKPNSIKGYGDKNWVVALVLCIFLGILGVHRYYLGYNGMFLIEFLTFGGFGILWIIDLIRIITKDLKPKNGRYK